MNGGRENKISHIKIICYHSHVVKSLNPETQQIFAILYTYYTTNCIFYNLYSVLHSQKKHIVTFLLDRRRQDKGERMFLEYTIWSGKLFFNLVWWWGSGLRDIKTVIKNLHNVTYRSWILALQCKYGRQIFFFFNQKWRDLMKMLSATLLGHYFHSPSRLSVSAGCSEAGLAAVGCTLKFPETLKRQIVSWIE